MGLGKTACAILGATLPALVVCPASLILNWWVEINLWRPEASDQFTVLSYASPSLKTIDPADFSTVVVDEAHYLKSPKAKRSRLACRLIAAIGARGKAIALSGTIVPNRPIELWPLLFSMGIYTGAFNSFGKRYADGWLAPWGPVSKKTGKARKVWDFSGSSNVRGLRRFLEPHTIRFTKAQVLPQLPPKTWRIVALDLPRPQQEKRFSLDSVSKLPKDRALAFEAYSDVFKIHGERKTPAALEHIENVLTGTRKVIVFAHHRDVVASLVHGLAAYNPASMTARMSPRQKQAAKDSFQTDPSVRVIVGQLKTMGVGHTLTAASHVVIVEGSWVPGDLNQAADRPHRIGQTENVSIDVLTISGSLDEHMLHRAISKMGTIEAIVPTTHYEAPVCALEAGQGGGEKTLTPGARRGYSWGDPQNSTHQAGSPISMSTDKIDNAVEQIKKGFLTLVELAVAKATAAPSDEAPSEEAATPRSKKKATRKKKASKKKAASKKAVAPDDEDDGPSNDETRKACMTLVDCVDEFGDDDDVGNEALALVMAGCMPDVDPDEVGIAHFKTGEDRQALIDACQAYISENYEE